MNSCSSLSSDRDSVPRLTYGPYRPFWTVISSPVPGSVPSARGSDSSRKASSSDTVSMLIDLSNDAVRASPPSSGWVVT